MIVQLPVPVPANIEYQQLLLENITYSPEEHVWAANVYGICKGTTCPLMFSAGSLVRWERVQVTDDEIAAYQELNPGVSALDAVVPILLARILAVSEGE